MAKDKHVWKLVSDYPINDYQCGARVGDRVRLRRAIVVRDHNGRATGVVYNAGEVWTVLSGAAEPPVVIWLRQADGERHTWNDDAGFWNWFEKVDDANLSASTKIPSS